MKNEVKLGDLHLRFPVFEDQIEPKGFLKPDKECHACWYYFMLAYASWLGAGTGPESQIIVVDPGLETPLWMEKRWHQIAKTVALIYGLESPDSFLPFAKIVEQEANRISPEGFEMPAEIWRPFMVGKEGRTSGLIGFNS